MKRLRVAFGPEAPAFGSWEWVGADLCQALAAVGHETTTFRDAVPNCDVIVFVKSSDFKTTTVGFQRTTGRAFNKMPRG